MNTEELWRSVLAEMELQISRPNFVTWLSGSRLLRQDEGTALVALPNNFSKEWVESRYSKTILGLLRNRNELLKKIEFVVAAQGEPIPLKSKRAPEKSEDLGQLSFSELKIDPETNLNPRYTLSSFVVGKSN